MWSLVPKSYSLSIDCKRRENKAEKGGQGDESRVRREREEIYEQASVSKQ